MAVNEPYKTPLAQKLLTNDVFISPQIVFECINVARKKLKYSPSTYFLQIRSILDICKVLEENIIIVELSLELIGKYSLQPFDAKIVATALHHGCNILYSEDMQNGLVINNKLKIINPFLNK